MNKIKTFIHFNFYASIGLTYLNYYLNKQSKPFFIFKSKFKNKIIKIFNTKLNYWLDNFFISGKDEYSIKSKVLNTCSRILKNESTLFF